MRDPIRPSSFTADWTARGPSSSDGRSGAEVVRDLQLDLNALEHRVDALEGPPAGAVYGRPHRETFNGGPIVLSATPILSTLLVFEGALLSNSFVLDGRTLSFTHPGVSYPVLVLYWEALS